MQLVWAAAALATAAASWACQKGMYVGEMEAQILSSMPTFDCFALLRGRAPKAAFFSHRQHWGCQAFTRATLSPDPDATSCDFSPEPLTMGRDLAVCHSGGACAEDNVAHNFGRRCCIRTYFQHCATLFSKRLRGANTEQVLRTLGQVLRFEAVIELFSHPQSLMAMDSFSNSKVLLLNGETAASGIELVDVRYRGRPQAKAGSGWLPARRLLARLPPGVYQFPPGAALTTPNRTAWSNSYSLHFLREPDSLLAAICSALTPGKDTLVLVHARKDLAREWSILSSLCNSVTAVVVLGSDMPGGTHYIREQLLWANNDWAEVHVWPEKRPDPEFPRGVNSLLLQRGLCSVIEAEVGSF